MTRVQPSFVGIRVHSGWGALVAIHCRGDSLHVIDRRRVNIIEPGIPGAAQPFHFVANFPVSKAREFIDKCSIVSRRLALRAMEDVAGKMREGGFAISGFAILLSSSRPLPAFEKILQSHALIHTAEGEFFRQAFRDAAEALSIPVSGVREREVESEMKITFGKSAPALQKKIAGLGRLLGSPWTADQKLATMAAAIALAKSR